MTLAGSVLIALLAIAVDALLSIAEKATRRHLEPSKERVRARRPAHARRACAHAKRASPPLSAHSRQSYSWLAARSPSRSAEEGAHWTRSAG